MVAAICTRYESYDMIKFGGLITAVSPFFLAFSTSIWATVMMVVTLSVGEAFWSPRTYSYTMSIAPEGKEASFSALASAPLFAAKIPVGMLSGYLLSTYVPENGHKDPKTLWLIIGLQTMSSPVGIILLERCIREPIKSEDIRRSESAFNPLNSTFVIRADDDIFDEDNEDEHDIDGGSSHIVDHLFEYEDDFENVNDDKDRSNYNIGQDHNSKVNPFYPGGNSADNVKSSSSSSSSSGESRISERTLEALFEE